MKADIIRGVRTADGYRYDVQTDGLIMGMRESVNRIQLGREALFAFIELVSLFERAELDALIRRIRKAEKKLGPYATADQIRGMEFDLRGGAQARHLQDVARGNVNPFAGNEERRRADAEHRAVCRSLTCKKCN